MKAARVQYKSVLMHKNNLNTIHIAQDLQITNVWLKQLMKVECIIKVLI